MNVTLGGDRLGSGNKNKLHLKNYERSTHNLSERFTSTMGCGMLIPCLCKPALRGDVFDININAACRTLPTNSPLFSTFKMQVDIFQCPVRLYQGILHNNPLFIGLKMSDVKFPRLSIETRCKEDESRWQYGEFAHNSLLKYLGMSGLGRGSIINHSVTMKRYINAIPALAYYDLAKNYYINKQEEQAYVITTQRQAVGEFTYFSEGEINVNDSEDYTIYANQQSKFGEYTCIPITNIAVQTGDEISASVVLNSNHDQEVYIRFYKNQIEYSVLTLADAKANGLINHYTHTYTQATNTISITVFMDAPAVRPVDLLYIYKRPKYENAIVLNSFDIANIDTMRLNLLSYHTLGSAYTIDNTYSDLPYSLLTEKNTDGITKNHYNLNGIMVKTYQADLFNAWVNTDWMEGENGIAEMSKIAVSDGAIYMDALLLAEKTYNMLNRIAVAGGTYEAWQDVVYQESSRKHIESPVYCGGISNEIVFEEIVQTTPTEGAPLGTLGGRGIAVKRKGGQVSIKVDEASFIMGIVSITPRVYYGQGNEFYMTELLSMDDLHKPALDGIGFQNLLGERMCWTDTVIDKDGNVLNRTKVGKVPAWVEYMTSVDKVYGEFLDLDKQGTMVLNRNYKIEDNGVVSDFTTYIDPAKYNYVFGNATLEAQNFWVQIDFDIKARRLMSAKQIPNL